MERHGADGCGVAFESSPRAVTHGAAPPGACPCGSAQRQTRGEHRFPPRRFRDSVIAGIVAWPALIFTLLALTGSALASPPGAVISNQATIAWQNDAGSPVSADSNIVELTVAVARSPADVGLTRVVPSGGGAYQESVGPAACMQGGAFVPLADPVLTGGATIDPAGVQDIDNTAAYNLGEPVFIRLEDADQNLDYQVIDVAVVAVSNSATGDSETIRLSETGPDTGVFAGYVPTVNAPASPGDCVLQGAPSSDVTVDYADPADPTDTARASAVLDPVQRVFESRSGTLVSGATIEIVYAASGLPASVYGNDGVGSFPSLITSGGAVTDSSGTSYVFGPGEFRFPVVPDGDYRLVVTPPPEYSAPSQVAVAELQALPGAPYALQPGSFGAAFRKAGGPGIGLDIPLDPRPAALFLQKQTLTTVAAPGDFVRYELALENASPVGAVSDIEIVDALPAGVRFVAGSTTVNGASAPDPDISANGTTLTFSAGTLAVAERVTVAYVVEIVGGRRGDSVTNRATAFGSGGLVSNEASVAIQLREDLFRNTATIIGRVVEGECSQDTFSEDQGVENIRIYLEDGRYAVTDAGGRFHFDNLEPGTHVAQLDTFSVPEYFDIAGCHEAPGFAGRADSQFVKLARGGLHRADFYLRRKPAPVGRIDLELQNIGTDSADEVRYVLRLDVVGNVPVSNIDLMFLLPDGVTYAPGSMRIDGRDLGNPRVGGQTLSMALDDRPGNWSSEITFRGKIGTYVAGELITKSVAQFDTPIESKQKTPLAETRMVREPAVMVNDGYVLDLKFDVLSAELSASDKAALDAIIGNWAGVRDIHVSAVGHTDSQRIAVRNRHIFANNYALSDARAMSAAGYVARALDIPPENVQVAGRGPDEPVASNTSAAGRQKNRRVEMVLSGLRPSKPSFLEVTRKSSGTQAAATKGAVPGTETTAAVVKPIGIDAGMPASQVEPAIDTLKPGISMLLPADDFQPAIPATKISIKHKPDQTVRLVLNGEPVSVLNFDTLAVNSARTVAVSRWKGVNLVDGSNRIRAVVVNADGSEARVLERDLYYSGPAIRGEFVADKSTLVADGKTRPIIAVRLFDRAGEPSRNGTLGTYRVNPPYRSWWDVENDRKNDLVTVGSRQPTYRVGPDGIALVELEPTTQAGEVTVNFKFENNRQQEIRAWLTPAPRDWILVGFAEGTVGYNTLAGNSISAMNADHVDGYFDDGRAAFFAKGQIRGEYLLTLAYDSSRRREQTRDRFETAVDPTALYTLYADASEQRFEASSQRKLYVKIERNQYVALFGDFDTGLSVTDLARYERRFNGFKSDYRGKNLGLTVFAANSDQAFRRDELRGDGTSGLYRLTAAPIVANSEVVRLEVRDRFDTSRVVSETRLSRFLDYNLDTMAGTVFFKQPVPVRDIEFNPVYIVIEYETLTNGAEDLVAGGRGSIRFADDRVEVGVSHVNDDATGAEADLTGVDLRWQVDERTLVTAEYAESNAVLAGTAQSGVAHSVEIEHNGERADVRAFMREVGDGFGLGYQSAADRGFRRLGVDARGRLTDSLELEGEAAWQQNLETEDIRNLARGLLRYKRNSFSATLGITHAEDEFADGESHASDTLDIGLSQQLFDGRLTLRGSSSTALSGATANLDYPTSTVLGAEYGILRGVDVIAEFEEAKGQNIDATMTRLGVRATPWNRAQINSTVTNEVTEFGPRLFANVGLVQGFQLNDRWTLDIGLDQTNTLIHSGARTLDSDRELASGSRNDDYLSAFVGAMYSADEWSANSRIEVRNSDTEERKSLLVGWYREPTAGHGLSASLTLFDSDMLAGGAATAADLRFGWAYRLADSKWAFLDRVDLVYDEVDPGTGGQSSWRIINNFNAHRRFSAAMNLSLQYAFKYVRSNFDGDSFTGFTDLIGVDVRRGLRSRWDIGANASVYHSYGAQIIDYGFGIDVGYNLLDNVWVSLGYNLTGFDDSDFREARYTAQGPFLRFSIKADQHSLKKIAGRR